jgi:hypothetical protein
VGVLLQKDKVIHHMVGGVIDFAGHRRAYRPDLLVAAKLDPRLDLHHLDTVQPGQEIEMPKGAAILAIGRRFQANRLLHADDILDTTVLDVT